MFWTGTPAGQGKTTWERVMAGDPQTVESAICFLEVRPYFFRSGYIFKDLLRKCPRAPLSTDQAARLRVIEQRLLAWRERKLAKNC